MFKKGLSFGAGLGVMLVAVAVLHAVASYPSSVKSFTTKLTNDTIQASHVNDIQDEIVAIEGGLLNGMAHDAKPSTDGVRDLGTASLKWRDVYLSRGILFPATQNPSSNGNLLDDYEEDSWTPTIGGSGGQSGQAYTTQVGRYVKVGQMVYAHAYVVLSTLGTITGDVQIKGLPFTVHAATNGYQSGTVGHWTAMTSTIVGMWAYADPNSTAINIRILTGAATATAAAAQANLSNTTGLMVAITYRATD